MDRQRNRSENARGDTNVIPHRSYTCIVALADLSNYQTFLTDSSQIKSLYKLLTAFSLDYVVVCYFRFSKVVFLKTGTLNDICTFLIVAF